MDIIQKVLTDSAFTGAIFSTIAIIMLGYYLRRTNKVDGSANKVLTSILLNVALPALAFNAFMTDISPQTFTTGLNTFIFGFIAYIVLIIISYIYSIKYKGNKLDAMRGLTIFGSTTFFGIPIITAFLGSEGTLYANLFNIAYRVFLYSYGLMLFSESKFKIKSLKTIFVNPIVIATFAGFIIWLVQNYLPTMDFTYTLKDGSTYINSYPILRLDRIIPWFTRALSYLGSLSSPLAWLAIGMTLAEISLKEAIADKDSWVYSIGKLVCIPAIFLAIIVVLNMTGIMVLNYKAIVAIVIMLATPPATVAVSYAINFDKESLFASNASLLSTVLAIVAIITWLIILTALNTAGVIV